MKRGIKGKSSNRQLVFSKNRGKTHIEYLAQPIFGKLLKRQIAFAQWQNREMRRLNSLLDESKLQEALHSYKREAMARQQVLYELERRTDEMKGRPLPEPLLYPPVPKRYIKGTTWVHHDLPADSVKIGYYTTATGFVPSNLIYPCPDDGNAEFWSAWFENGQVSLRRCSKHLIEGSAFTGQLKLSMRIRVEGVADINSGGLVVLSGACWAYVNRNIGTDEQPQWYQVGSANRGTAYPHIRITSVGLVSLTPVDISLYWEFSEARPGDLINIWEEVGISVVNGTVQMGPNRNACASGGCYGFIHTWIPRLDLEYHLVRKERPFPQ